MLLNYVMSYMLLKYMIKIKSTSFILFLMQLLENLNLDLFGGLYCTACGILIPQPGIEPWAHDNESTES